MSRGVVSDLLALPKRSDTNDETNKPLLFREAKPTLIAKLTQDSKAMEQVIPEMKYGEREIEDGQLTTFPNPRPGRKYNINITLPEFTCKCPFSGYPDFGTIHVIYSPDQKVVELKALKLYINSYRDRYISHEESANQILDDLVAAMNPLSITVKADYTPRGNVHTVVEVSHQQA